MLLFSSHSEAWREFEKGFKDIALRYTQMAINSTSNRDLQQQYLGKVDMCLDLAKYREALEAKQ